MIFDKKLTDLKEQDLQKLVDDQVQEQDTIEYKRDMYGSSDDDKREMLKDITSMANHHGGYVLIGIDENDEGIPTRISGIEQGNHNERIMSCCLSNIDKRIFGLEVQDVPLENGRVVIVVSIPESINAPHMILYRGLNQFWKRHGRQKDKMIIDEIGEAFNKRLSGLNRLDRFLYLRKSEVLENLGNNPWIILASAPSYLGHEIIFDIHDNRLQNMLVNPSKVNGSMGDIYCGTPYPTINGLRADNHTPYSRTQRELDSYIEVFANGYIEYGVQMHEHKIESGFYFTSVYDTAYIINFINLLKNLYESYIPLSAVVVDFTIYNAKGIWLFLGANRDRELLEKWEKQHLELGKFYAENIKEGYRLLPKRICDRLWQAFHLEKANVFDDDGNFIYH